MTRNFLILLFTICSISCKEEALPKPDGYLRLDYPEAVYEATTADDCPYLFEKNTLGSVRFEQDCDATISYPLLNGTLFLTYRSVDGNIRTLLRDAQKLTYEHVIKADDIIEEKFIDGEKKVFGMFYDVSGNAASQSQFYVTDSVNHFLSGSIYFNAKPNYDSILPAAVYLKKDIRKLMETVSWQ